MPTLSIHLCNNQILTSDYILAGLASCGATVFSNPIEVVKIRLQLQGELAARGTYVQSYGGLFPGLITVAKKEGLWGLQKGLLPAMYFQFVVNGVRFGIFHTAQEQGWMNKSNGELSFPLGIFWGAFGGAVGAYLSSPFFLIKTQIQSFSAKDIAVGYQHGYMGFNEAFKDIYKKGGIAGLWRGSLSGLPRAVSGSGAQIATFGKTKMYLRDNDFVTQPSLNSFCAGLIAGSFMAVVMTPPDVVSTRMYNQGLDAQGRGLLYTGWWDCLRKIVRTEGPYGLYKGFMANYARIAPHSTLMLLFYDKLDLFAKKYLNKT